MALESQHQAQEDKARVHLGENPPAEASLTTLKTFCLFPEAHCTEMGICAICSRKAPLELGRAITTGAWGEVALPLYGVRLGIYFHIPIKLGLLFPLEMHAELLVEQ